MRGLFSLSLIVSLAICAVHAANFSVTVDGTASHAVPETLCE